MRSKAAGFVLGLILTGIFICQVSAVPPLPAEFYGSIMIDGGMSGPGTVVIAKIDGVEKGSITSTGIGFFGGPGLFDPRLKVNVTEEEFQAGNLTLTFEVDGRIADQTIPFEPGVARQLDLTVTAPLVPSTTSVNNSENSTASGAVVQTQVPVTLPTETVPLTLPGKRVFISPDKRAEVIFEPDTMLFSPAGQFLNEITVNNVSASEKPADPADTLLRPLGLIYTLTPNGTYFNPKGRMNLYLPPETLSGIIAEKPAIYEYLPDAQSWVNLSTSVNTTSGSISTDIYEAGIYAVFLTNGSSTLMMAPIAGKTGSSALLPPPTLSPVLASVSEATVQATTSIPPIPGVPESTLTYPPTPAPTSTPETSDSSGIDKISIQNATPFQFPPIREGISNIISSIPSPIPYLASLVNRVSTFFHIIRDKMNRTVLIGIGVFVLVIIVNLVVFSVYTRWWLVRRKNA